MFYLQMRSRRIGSNSRTISSRPHIPEMTDDDLQHIITEWTNMSGFLCSLATGGGRSVRPMSTVPSASSVESLTTLNMYSSTIGEHYVCKGLTYICMPLNSVMVLKWCMLIIGICLLILCKMVMCI